MVFSAAGFSAEGAWAKAEVATRSRANPDTIQRLIVNLLRAPAARPASGCRIPGAAGAGAGGGCRIRGSVDPGQGRIDGRSRRANAPEPTDDRPGISAQRPPTP